MNTIKSNADISKLMKEEFAVYCGCEKAKLWAEINKISRIFSLAYRFNYQLEVLGFHCFMNRTNLLIKFGLSHQEIKQ